MSTGILTGTYKRPDGTARTGTVTITPSVAVVRNSAGNIILAGPVSADLDASGSFTVTLAASNDSALDPAGVTYKVTGHGALRGIPAVAGIAVPAGQTIDMADVTPVDPAAPTYAPWVYGTGGGSGTITSVNGNVGPTVVLGASDVGARPVSYVPTWTEVTSKPTTFAPSAHTHPTTDVTGFAAATRAVGTYGKLNGRTIRGRAGGRSSAYANVTTTLTSSFTAYNIPLAEPFVSTGLQQGTNSVTIPAAFSPGWYEINCSLKFNGGSTGTRNMPIQLNGSNLFEVKGYGPTGGTTTVCTYRTFLKPGDIITLQAYVETTGVTVVADSGSAVYLDVVALDRPKVQPLYFGWSQALAEPATVATATGKNELLSIFFPVSSWNDVQGDSMVSDTALTNYRTSYADRAVDVAGPLIPHGLGSGTWDAALDAVVAGTYDARFTTLGQNLATYGTQTVYYRPWWEFNLSTMQPTAAKFIAAWNRAVPIIRAAFAAAAPTKVLNIVWCWSEGADPLTWYPSTGNVDVISADIYAMVFGTSTPSLNQLADKVNAQLSTLAHHGALKSKPIAISEFAQCAVQPGPTTFQGRGDEPSVMDIYFDFFENAAVLFAGYHNFSASGVGITLKDVPNTAARLEQRRALLSRLG